MDENERVLLLVVGEWILRLGTVALVLLRRNARSASSLTWIVVILALPLFGPLLFLAFGFTRLPRSRIRRYRELVARIEKPELKAAHQLAARAGQLSRDDRSLALLAESLGASPVVGGNAIELMGDTDVVIARMAADIDAAREHCHLLFYIYLDDDSGTRIADALIAAAARGVTCRLLVDAIGSRPFLRSALCRRLRAGGVRVAAALPVNPVRALFSRIDLRNHRKIMVIDRYIGYTGSQNIANADFAPKASYAPWVDAMVRISGPAVHDLQTLFVEDWFLDTHEALDALLGQLPPPHADGVAVQVFAAGPTRPADMMRMLVQAATQMARHELVLTTPYFVPDEALVAALATSARCGTRVTLIVPERNDSRLVALASRSYYGTLLEAGVRILEFRDGLLHAKTLTVDGHVAMMTSANIDRRSLDINFEAGIVVYDSDFARQLRDLQGRYMQSSNAVDARSWGRRPVITRLSENGAALLAPLL
jgi:cardiolipin synthase